MSVYRGDGPKNLKIFLVKCCLLDVCYGRGGVKRRASLVQKK